MTFEEMAEIGKDILAKQKPTTIEQARAQVEKLKKNFKMKIEFIEDEFDIVGRGKVFIFKLKENNLPQEVREFKKLLFVGKQISIKDKNWEIIGIEGFKTMGDSLSNSVGVNVKEI